MLRSEVINASSAAVQGVGIENLPRGFLGEVEVVPRGFLGEGEEVLSEESRGYLGFIFAERLEVVVSGMLMLMLMLLIGPVTAAAALQSWWMDGG
jgi:hypothetical protein